MELVQAFRNCESIISKALSLQNKMPARPELVDQLLLRGHLRVTDATDRQFLYNWLLAFADPSSKCHSN